MRDPIHSGETLREYPEALDVSVAELSRRIEMPVNRIIDILNGRRSITGDTALSLGHFSARKAGSGPSHGNSVSRALRNVGKARQSPL
ncbi:MAG: hypothetical protein OXE82_14395 [Rhodobacter sp.]|nr:hypothetical protein [Rhodobacter sp.]